MHNLVRWKNDKWPKSANGKPKENNWFIDDTNIVRTQGKSPDRLIITSWS
jgi:hypothetical protein